jgi:IS605 OrfB family transposase
MPIKPIPKTLIRNSKFWIDKKCEGSQIESNSWFDIYGKSNPIKKKQQIYKKYKKVIIHNDIVRCRKVILKPTQKQRHILKTWLEICRQVYNLTVKYLRHNKLKSKRTIRDEVRNHILKYGVLQNLIVKYKVPLHTINYTIFDVVMAYKAALSNLKAKNIKHFRLRYKKFSKSTQILVLESSVFNTRGTGLKAKILDNLHASRPIYPKKDTRLQLNKKTGEFAIFIPERKEKIINLKRMKRCALDPGIRAFQSVYSDNKAHYQFATTSTNKIKNIIQRIEKVKNRKNETWYTNFTSKLRAKIRNKIADLHWKTARFLCERFDNILIGNMSTKGIIKKHSSVLNSAMKRFCIALSHFTFNQRLQAKCEEFNVNFEVVDESYTSKTCGKCGELNEKLGSNELFICAHVGCKYSMPRDIHGARNILIKHTS